VLSFERQPELRDPLLIVALTGWVDAGLAGAGAVAALREQLQAPDEFASLDLADVMDLQQTRPTARWGADGVRVIDWPTITFVAGRLGRDAIVVSGPEPSTHWLDVTRAVVDTARSLGVRQGFTLAGMPALVSHRRPVPVLATATHRSFAQELAPLRLQYAGPTGLQTVVQRALGDADIPCAGLWAQVPQYVSGSPSPPAVRALLRRLAELTGLEIDLRPLDARTESYTTRVDAGLASRPDVQAVVDRIDQEQVASTDDLVSEIELFLRSQDDE
jgi:proteasome assembly chaperone (PAC2) family protein